MSEEIQLQTDTWGWERLIYSSCLIPLGLTIISASTILLLLVTAASWGSDRLLCLLALQRVIMQNYQVKLVGGRMCDKCWNSLDGGRAPEIIYSSEKFLSQNFYSIALICGNRILFWIKFFQQEGELITTATGSNCSAGTEPFKIKALYWTEIELGSQTPGTICQSGTSSVWFRRNEPPPGGASRALSTARQPPDAIDVVHLPLFIIIHDIYSGVQMRIVYFNWFAVP